MTKTVHGPSRNATDDTKRSGLRARIDRWLDSDLVGIAAAAYTFFILAVSLLVFRVVGGVAGMVVGVALWIPMVLFAIQGRGKELAPVRLATAAGGPVHRVLVVANVGLEEPALRDEVCRRADRTATEAMVIAPVVAHSRLAELSDDIDHESKIAGQRLERALAGLRREGVNAWGRVDLARPMESLLDGLREFPANEIVMLPDSEAGWDAAAEMAERVRIEVGLPVTTVKAKPATMS